MVLQNDSKPLELLKIYLRSNIKFKSLLISTGSQYRDSMGIEILLALGWNCLRNYLVKFDKLCPNTVVFSAPVEADIQ